jgi:hypothetical protein
MNRENTNNDFNDLENDASYTEAQYLIGLEIIRKEKAMKNPDDLGDQLEYGDVLVFNKKYQEALDFFSPIYQKHYKKGIGVEQIIDSLIGLGKTEKDFNWIVPPKILHLDMATLDLCTKFLNDQKEAVHILALFDELFLRQSDHMTFDEYEFSDFILQNNDNFILIGDLSKPLDYEIKIKQ